MKTLTKTEALEIVKADAYRRMRGIDGGQERDSRTALG